MGTPFENFVNLELPRRPALLTQGITGYDGDPNNVAAPVIFANAPAGTFYLQTTGGDLWRKKSVGATTWVVVGGSGGGVSTAVVSATEYECPFGADVGHFVYLSGPDTVGLALASDISTMPSLGVIVGMSDATHCIVQYNGELDGYVGLSPDTHYYVSATDAGAVTTAIPTDPGSVMQVVGTARNTTTLIVSVDFMDYTLL